MSRRDTIIVAALVNAGLLIVLFVSALKNPKDSEPLVVKREVADLIVSEAPIRSEPKKIVGDEVEQVLKQYVKQDPLAEPIQPIAAAPSASFAQDLQSIAEPVAAPVPVLASLSEPSKEQSPAIIEVKVKKGDMLEKIAREHNTSVAQIMKLNHLSSSQLKIGQVLKVQQNAPKTAKAEAALAEATPSKFYTVKPGDNPWTIAVKNHMKVEELLKLNSMSEEKSRKLKPGDQIRVR
jgi:LysM repeat protein